MRVWCAISGHGFGHFFQVAPILNTLNAQLGWADWHIVGKAPTNMISKYLNINFTHDFRACDAVLVHKDPILVDLEATIFSFENFLSNEDQKIYTECHAMREWQPDLVIGNIPYFTCAAAEILNIPCVAVAGITWDKVIAQYFPECPPFQDWQNTIRNCYKKATLALLPTPCDFHNIFKKEEMIPPVTIPGVRKRTLLRQSLCLDSSDNRPIVLLGFGGIPCHVLPFDIKSENNIIWLTDIVGVRDRSNIFPITILRDWLFTDIAASVDVIVSKPGYNMAVAASAHGIPFIYIRRGKFPDEDVICSWLSKNNRSFEITNTVNMLEDISGIVSSLLEETAPPIPAVNGANNAVNKILELI